MKFYFNSLAISIQDLNLFCTLLNYMGDTFHYVKDNNGNIITLIHIDYGKIRSIGECTFEDIKSDLKKQFRL